MKAGNPLVTLAVLGLTFCFIVTFVSGILSHWPVVPVAFVVLTWTAEALTKK